MYSALFVCLALVALSFGAPVHEEIFPGLVNDASLSSPDKESDIVKRRIYPQNNDATLKQVSLHSLIGDLEDSLFQSALSVSGVVNDKAELLQVKPSIKQQEEHGIMKRQSAQEASSVVEVHNADRTATTGSASVQPMNKAHNVLLQTSERVPQREGVPAHILIDRLTVQPLNGHDFPLIPAFQVLTKQVTTTATVQEHNVSKDGTNPTTISITKTNVKSTTTEVKPSSIEHTKTASIEEAHGETKQSTIVVTPVAETVDPFTKPATTQSVVASSSQSETTTASTSTAALVEGTSSSSSSSTTTTSAPTTSTTKTSIVELKQAEEELKEKVAEVEAEPVILSARV